MDSRYNSDGSLNQPDVVIQRSASVQQDGV